MGSQDSSIRFRKTYLLGLGENLITRIGETLVANYTTYTFTQIGDTLVSNCTTDSACATATIRKRSWHHININGAAASERPGAVAAAPPFNPEY